MFKNKYDVVETNKMAAEDVRAWVDGDRVAAHDIENGRLIVREEDTYKYAGEGEEGTLFLATTPERVYNGEGVDEFFNPEGRLLRAFRLQQGDIFSTTAVEGKPSKGDKLTVAADGKLAEGEGAVVFEVIGTRMLGKEIGFTVELQ